MRHWIIFGLLFAPVARGQVVVLSAGSSSQMETPFGAGATLYLLDTVSTFGLGYSNGTTRWTAGTAFFSRGSQWIVGDSQVTGTSVGFQLRGLSMIRKSSEHRQRLVVFVGAMGSYLSTGFYSGFTPLHFGAGVYFTRTFFADDSLRIETTDNLQGAWRTALQAITLTKQRAILTASGGLLQGGKVFNAAATVRPWERVTLTAAHSDLIFWTPILGTGDGKSETATVSNVGASVALGSVNVHGGYVQSVAAGVHNAGEMVGVSARVGAWALTADYFATRVSKPMLDTSVSYRPSPHWSVSAYGNASPGNWSASPGAAYTSNEFSASVGLQVLYYPFLAGRSPFEKALSLNLSFHAPHGSTVNLSSVALPTGKMLYTVGGNSWFQGALASGASGLPAMRHSHGRNLYSGVCELGSGEPVEGCAAYIGKEEVFSDAHGRFELLTNQAKPLPLRIEPRDFTTPVDFVVVSSPDSISTGVAVVIVVRPLERK